MVLAEVLLYLLHGETGGRLLTAGESRLIDAFTLLDLVDEALAGELSHSSRRRLSGRRHRRIESCDAQSHDPAAIESVGSGWSQEACQRERKKENQRPQFRTIALVR